MDNFRLSLGLHRVTAFRTNRGNSEAVDCWPKELIFRAFDHRLPTGWIYESVFPSPPDLLARFFQMSSWSLDFRLEHEYYCFAYIFSSPINNRKFVEPSELNAFLSPDFFLSFCPGGYILRLI